MPVPDQLVAEGAVLSNAMSTADPHVAAEWLHTGRLLAYPTESVWGLGCDPFNEQAVTHLLAIKARPVSKGLIVLTASVEDIQPFLAPLPASRQAEIITSWQTDGQQQASTWLLPIPDKLPMPIPDWVTGGRATLAIRVIAHETIKALCTQLRQPSNPYGFLISTSCNPSAYPPAQNLQQAQDYFAELPEVGFLSGQTLHFTAPSQIREALTGQVVRD